MKTRRQWTAAWDTAARLTQELLAAVGDARLGLRYAPRARTVRTAIVHMHNARLAWMGAMGAEHPQATRLKSRDPHDVAALSEALAASGAAVSAALQGLPKHKPVPGFERSPVEVLAYMLAHEAHHRAQIILCLRLAGQPLPRAVIQDLWEY